MHELLAALRRDPDRLRRDWRSAASLLADWSDPGPAPGRVAGYLRRLPAADRTAITERSRETATHFAWCLNDEPDEPFSVWVNEYKDPHRWPASYANSVHNHRYDFCTRILVGGYRHERYHAMLDPGSRQLTEVTLRDQQETAVGTVLVVPAESYHRVPTARSGTMSLLVKLRPRFAHSISYDPATGVTQVHVPIEARVDELIDALDSR